MKEKSKKSSKNKDLAFIYKLIGLGLVIVLFWALFSKGGPKLITQTQPTIIQSSAQLNSSKDGKSWATATKSTNGINFELSVTAFLPKPAKGMGYYVFLKGNGSDLSDMLIGKLELAGDVYSLNYTSGKDLFGYKDIVIVMETEAQAKEGKTTPEVIKGTFPN